MSLPAAEPLASPPKIMGEAVQITSGPYNGLRGNLCKLCDTWCSVVIEFEHQWFEIVTESRWLKPLAVPSAA
jgi:hypothetical protein